MTRKREIEGERVRTRGETGRGRHGWLLPSRQADLHQSRSEGANAPLVAQGEKVNIRNKKNKKSQLNSKMQVRPPDPWQRSDQAAG